MMQISMEVPPRAGALCESIRGMGYSLDTAIADIIDNSISAKSSRIEIYIDASMEGAKIEIRDNGIGMTRNELINAMSLGSLSPTVKRKENDLGRFGLGLKTASFSQCRRLTVTSKKHCEASSFIWDIDHLVDCDQWDLIENTADLPQISEDSGTVVQWSAIDKIEWLKTGTEKADWLAALTKLQKSLELTFHRFLEDGDFKLFLNGRCLQPLDPFFSNNPGAPRTYPEEPLYINKKPVAKVRLFLIPQQEYRMGIPQYGADDELDLQGFFLYREKRLISHGGWLGLKGLRRGREFGLARIRVDFHNDADADWQIDIRKSIARPPKGIKEALRKYAMRVRVDSEHVLRASTKHSKPVVAKSASMWLKRRNSIPLPDASDPVVMVMHEQLSGGNLDTDLVQGWEEILSYAHPAVAERASCLPRSKQVNRTVEFIYQALTNWLGIEESRSIDDGSLSLQGLGALMMTIFSKKGRDVSKQA